MPNPHIQILDTKILSDQWYVLKKITFRQEDRQGNWHTASREAYDRGNGAVILLKPFCCCSMPVFKEFLKMINRVMVLTDIEADPQTVHFILKVTDKGSPALTRYKRVIVTINL